VNHHIVKQLLKSETVLAARLLSAWAIAVKEQLGKAAEWWGWVVA